MGRLTTHVLDTAHGRPGGGMRVQLHRLADGRQLLKSTVTNVDGRCDSPLLEGADFAAGLYELTFHAGAYFRKMGVALSDPPFIDEVVLRVGLAEPEGHYHVPLLVSPWSYSTYRGS